MIWIHIAAAVPPEPDVPADLTVLSRDVQCGSGGCYRELLVAGATGQSGREVVSALGLEVGREECRPRSLIDRRIACRYVGRVDGDDVRLSTYYDRSFTSRK